MARPQVLFAVLYSTVVTDVTAQLDRFHSPPEFGCRSDVLSPLVAQDPKVELKIRIDESAIDAALANLGLLPEGGEIEDISFTDTPQLELLRGGLILRTRRAPDGTSDTTVKIRPMDPARVRWREGGVPENGFKCEVDRTEQNSVTSCSLKVKGAELTAAQRDFIADNSPIQPDWPRLRPHGPIHSRAWETGGAGENLRKVDVELWTLPGGQRSLEVSIKVPAARADAAMTELRAWLAGREVAISPVQGQKTLGALESLAAPPN